MASDFTFGELLVKYGLDPSKGRVVRHNSYAQKLWDRSVEDFEHFVSEQLKSGKGPYHGTDIVYQFVSYGKQEALFVGAHKILDRWCGCDDLERRPAFFYEGSAHTYDIKQRELFDLERIEILDDLVGRIMIDWGAGTRSWSQWLKRHDKPIIEIRSKVSPPSFPGFEGFSAVIKDIPSLPLSWQEALSSVSGVYLIVTERGAQYVGSAYGAEGFWGRWLDYARNGHGGNLRLREINVFDATISILKVMDPASSIETVVAEENRWKQRLGSRAFGLNAN